jgi:hypothetical protein
MKISKISKSSFANPNRLHYKIYRFYMVAKTMIQQELCQDCNQRSDCQKVYRQLGNVEGPSVVKKVIQAFLVPLVVFIASLAVFEKVLSGVVSTEQAQTALSFVSALLLTLVCILVIRAINRQFDQDK